jgi:SOS response regulatory protein OraA/RecX
MKHLIPVIAVSLTSLGLLRAEPYDSRKYSSRDRYAQESSVRYGEQRSYQDTATTDRHTAYQVQKALARKGYYNGVIDGELGPRSREAIREYQRSKGLYPSGRVTGSLLTSLHITDEDVRSSPQVREHDHDRFESRDHGRKGSVPARVQLALAEKGFYRGSVDGVIGYQSQEAIRRYQRSRGLRATGIIDDSLLRALRLV